MELALAYVEEAETGLPESFFQDVAVKTIGAAGKQLFLNKRVAINAIAVSEEKIRALNSAYRHKDSVTDILSFGEYSTESVSGTSDVFLGELFFCPAFIRSAAIEDGVSFHREMVYVFSHGILHLLGYDHEEEMFIIQDRVTDECALQ